MSTMPATSSAPDTPRTAYKVLELRATLITCGLLVALAGVAWWSTVDRARGMTDMVQGLSSVSSAMMTFDMSAGIFLAMWTTMMVAMMFPTIAPIVLLHRMVMRRAHRGVGLSVVFAAGYLVVWTVAGLIPLGALVAFRQFAHGTSWAAPAGGVVLAVAGAYQFTRWKDVCQRACRTPMSFLMTHDFGSGLLGAFRTGVSHGLYCLGCCWALMTVLFVVGLMNLAWMAAISVVFLAEKNWRYGPELTKVVGGGLILLGTMVLIHPALLASVAA